MKSRWIQATGIVLACALLLGVMGFFAWRHFSQDEALVASEPLHTVVFEDGARMDVLAIGIGTVRHQQAPAKKHWFGAETSSYSSYAHGFFHGGNLDTRVKEKNGVKAWSAVQEIANPLLIGIRLHDSSGRPMNVARSFSPMFLHDDSRLEKRSGGSIKRENWGEFTGDEAAAQLQKSGIVMHIQHLDPDSGWIPLSGPLWIGEEHPADHVIALSVWRRDLKTLKFRAIRDTGEIIEFELPAPPTPAADVRTITAEALPITRTGANYTVRLEGIEIREHPGGPPAIHVAPVLESPRYSTGKERHAQLEGWVIGVRDEAGNLDPFKIYHRDASGGSFQRQSSRLEILYQLKRRDTFRMPDADCLMIADGVVSADGSEVVFTPLAGAEQMGIEAIPAMAIGPSEDGFWSTTVGEHVLNMRIEGKLTEAAMPRQFHGQEPTKLRIVIFQEGDAESSGISAFKGSGSSSFSGSVRVGTSGGSHQGWEYRREDDWYAPTGALAPGKRIRMALAPPLEDDLHIFPIEIPAE